MRVRVDDRFLEAGVDANRDARHAAEGVSASVDARDLFDALDAERLDASLACPDREIDLGVLLRDAAEDDRVCLYATAARDEQLGPAHDVCAEAQAGEGANDRSCAVRLHRVADQVSLRAERVVELACLANDGVEIIRVRR